MFKFIHAADIHLDSARHGVRREQDAPALELRQAPRRAFQNLIQLAIQEDVAFVLLAGDLYDGDWPDFHTGLFFLEQAARLNKHGIRVFMIAGNHDAANVMTRSLPLPADGSITMFDADRPQTEKLDDLRVAIHGQSFANRAVTEDLAEGYPIAAPGMFNIGLLHTSATFGAGEHDCYASCSLDTLLSKNYDYWALGHIHIRQDLRRGDAEPPIVFPGNLQGRHVRETGPKGCMLVTVEDDHSLQSQFVAVDVLRWERCPVELTGARQLDEVVRRVTDSLSQLNAASDNRPLAVRIELEGACEVHRQLVSEPSRCLAEIQAAALTWGPDKIWIERVVRHTTVPATDQATSLDGPVGELSEFIDTLKNDDQACKELLEELQPLRAKLPAELTEGTGSLRLEQPERLRELLDDARELLMQRIQGSEDNR